VAATAGGDEGADGRKRDREKMEQQLRDALAEGNVADDRPEQPQLGHHQGDCEQQDCPWSPDLEGPGHRLRGGSVCSHTDPSHTLFV
jgi:hypothetical protein